MCVRCGTGVVAWCTDPMRHGESQVALSPEEPLISELGLQRKDMVIFRLTGREDIGAAYEPVAGFIITARSEIDARALASTDPGDEGSDYWLLEANCEAVGYALPGVTAQILIRDQRHK